MNDDRKKKPLPQKHDQDERAEMTPVGGARRDERDGKPSRIERRDWRGSGVVGDRHTD